MIRYLLTTMIAVLWVTSEAAAIECSAEARSRTGHWSWRMIDGKKCWYPGRPGMDKAKLRWPATTVGQRDPEPPDVAPAAAVALQPLRASVQRNGPESAQPETALTFTERWPNYRASSANAALSK